MIKPSLSLVFAALSFATAAEADDPQHFQIIDFIEMSADFRSYQALSDGNIRVGPATSFKTAGTVRQGDIVHSRGRAGAWIAVATQAGDIGFVWEGIFAPTGADQDIENEAPIPAIPSETREDG